MLQTDTAIAQAHDRRNDWYADHALAARREVADDELTLRVATFLRTSAGPWLTKNGEARSLRAQGQSRPRGQPSGGPGDDIHTHDRHLAISVPDRGVGSAPVRRQIKVEDAEPLVGQCRDRHGFLPARADLQQSAVDRSDDERIPRDRSTNAPLNGSSRGGSAA